MASVLVSCNVLIGLEDWFKHNINVIFHARHRTEVLLWVAIMIKGEIAFSIITHQLQITGKGVDRINLPF